MDESATSLGARFSTRLAQAMRRGASGRVMVSSRHAAYASLDDGGIVAIVGDRADPPPVGVLVAHADDIARIAPPTAHVALGPTGIRVDGITIRVAGWWSPVRVLPSTPDGDAAAVLRRLRRGAPLSDFDANLLDLVIRRIDEAAARWALGDDAGTRESLHAILGLGPGSTPAGDDAIAGFLVGLRAFARSGEPGSARADLGAGIADLAATRTTTVSAGLLREAACGYCAPSLGDAVHALGTDFGGTAEDRDLALSTLVAVGHTSGIATAAGLVAAMRSADSLGTHSLGTHPLGAAPSGAATAHHHERTSWAPLT